MCTIQICAYAHNTDLCLCAQYTDFCPTQHIELCSNAVHYVRTGMKSLLVSIKLTIWLVSMQCGGYFCSRQVDMSYTNVVTIGYYTVYWIFSQVFVLKKLYGTSESDITDHFSCFITDIRFCKLVKG